MGILNKGIVEKLAWFGANIATTLTIVTVVVVSGPLGSEPIPGSSGVSGVPGIPGSSGISGVPGIPGSSGVPGSQGEIGSSGVPGSQGEIGSSGVPGSQGEIGSSGVPGSQGEIGSSGIPGVDGAPGVDGRDYSTIYPVQRLNVPPAPLGDARSIYAQSLVSQGYTPLSSVEDFSIFTDHESDELNTFGNREAYFRGTRYVLTADIDFSESNNDVFSNRLVAFEQDQNGGVRELYFQGTFDGAGFSIKNFIQHQIQSRDPAAFIPYAGSGAVIRNLTFENMEVSSINGDFDRGNFAGGVIGYVNGPTVLENITIKDGVVVAEEEAGGVVGVVNDNLYLINVNNINTSVFGQNSAGGLVGSTESVDDVIYHLFIQDSSNSGTLDSRNLNPIYDDFMEYIELDYDEHAGGFVGAIQENESVIILNSYNTGEIISQEGEAAGFIGDLNKSDLTVIANSYNSGFVAAFSNEAGGFVGDLASTEKVFIQNSFNLGQVHSTSSAGGGFIGELGSSSHETTTATTYITNAYNAGYISTQTYFDDEKGGLIGQVNNDRHVIITNSFNVGSFSVSVTDLSVPRYLSRNGAIIGDPEGNVALDNVAFYVDETKPENYLNHAMQDLHPLIGTRITDRTKFEASSFMYQSIWNMDSIWMFQDNGYPFPVLRNLTFVNADNPFLFNPEFINDTGIGDYKVEYDEVLEENIIHISELSVYAKDVETSFSNLNIQLYAVLGSGVTIQTVLATGDLFTAESRTQFGIESIFEDLSVFPTQGDGEYFFYVVVTDNGGNQVMVEINASIIYKIAANNLPPNPGVLNVAIGGLGPNILDVSISRSTDDLTRGEGLTYYFVIAPNTFDFASYNPITNANQQGLLFQQVYVGFNDDFLNSSIDISSLNLDSGVYKTTVYVVDELNAYSVYAIVDLTIS
jgi:hypothetical protein